MRVIHLITNLDSQGGAQRLVANLSLYSDQFEPEVHVLDPSDGYLYQKLNSNGIKVKKISKTSYYLVHLRSKKNKYTILHVHLFPALYYGALLHGVRKIYTEHGVTNRRREIGYLNSTERFIYSRYNKVCAISEGGKRNLDKWLGGTCNIEVVPNGIVFENTKKARDLQTTIFTLGMVARFSESKDQLTLIKLMTVLPKKYSLVLVGDGSSIQAHKQFARELDVIDRVTFTGYLDDALFELRNFDLYIQSSHYEGFGLAPLEAMAMGIPTIGSNIFGLRETIGRSDAVFEKGDVSSLAKKVLSIAEDKTYYDELARYGREISKKFQIENTVKRYESIYCSVLGL